MKTLVLLSLIAALVGLVIYFIKSLIDHAYVQGFVDYHNKKSERLQKISSKLLKKHDIKFIKK